MKQPDSSPSYGPPRFCEGFEPSIATEDDWAKLAYHYVKERSAASSPVAQQAVNDYYDQFSQGTATNNFRLYLEEPDSELDLHTQARDIKAKNLDAGDPQLAIVNVSNYLLAHPDMERKLRTLSIANRELFLHYCHPSLPFTDEAMIAILPSQLQFEYLVGCIVEELGLSAKEKLALFT